MIDKSEKSASLVQFTSVVNGSFTVSVAWPGSISLRVVQSVDSVIISGPSFNIITGQIEKNQWQWAPVI